MKIENYIKQDETILWRARPRIYFALNKKLYLGLALVALIGLGAKSLGYFRFLPGLGLLIFLAWDCYGLKSTKYYLTTRSLIILDRKLGGARLRRRALDQIDWDKTTYSETRFGFGDIIFEKDLYHSQNTCAGQHTYKVKDGFFFLGIQHPGQAYDLFLKNQA